MPIKDDIARQGILAFGDSITNGGGGLQYGVALQSWVQWLARALGLPFTSYAVDGATTADVVTLQQPGHARINAVPDARYQLGCLYIGVNDVRLVDWDAGAYARDLDAAAGYLDERCDTLLQVTIPLDLGRPRAGAKVPQANAIVRATAERHGARVLDLDGLHGRAVMMADHIHPTALGQIAIAERAIDALAGTGLTPKLRPHSLVHTPARRQRLRYDLSYARKAADERVRILRETRSLGRALRPG